MKRLVLGALLVTAVSAVTAVTPFVPPAQAQVHVDIGIRLPGPPALVVIPGAPVYYAPQAPANVFFYAQQYWVFTSRGWHVGPTWNGPWVIVEPVRVPAPILLVPVRYYPAPPPPWRGWKREAPPQWDAHYGREWREDAHERQWREHEEKWEHGGRKGCPPGLAKQGRC